MTLHAERGSRRRRSGREHTARISLSLGVGGPGLLFDTDHARARGHIYNYNLMGENLEESTLADYQRALVTSFEYQSSMSGRPVVWEPVVRFRDRTTDHEPRDYLTRVERQRLGKPKVEVTNADYQPRPGRSVRSRGRVRLRKLGPVRAQPRPVTSRRQYGVAVAVLRQPDPRK